MLKVEVEMKTACLTALKAHEYEGIVRHVYAWVQDGDDFEDMVSWIVKQYANVIDLENRVSNGWKFVEKFIQDNNEDGYVEWNRNNFYGTAWNSEADAYVREQFRKFQIALGKR